GPPADPPPSLEELIRRSEEDPEGARRDLQALAERQSAVRLEDLLLRRTDWGIHPQREAVAERLCETLGWVGAPGDGVVPRPPSPAMARGVR
ncbi:MAG TPA: hypothetical protein VHN15_03685, partial [Thermoanaerobaculia bacterium]|nr:hypothetical protein [Thermoanaerobaculia bacterium]